MKRLIVVVALCALAASAVEAQNSRTTSKMLYHDGPVLTGTQNLGQTYRSANGARANIRLDSRDYLIQQNWVNDRKGRCAMSQ